ncbi:hypothetical protein F4781DRAFT_415414 [Annulohypoxylon bovei var. microspora]|nr:hypothetical protein F4781DRAFT_415414 [Annulohypoxylon bovei var. microspora]
MYTCSAIHAYLIAIFLTLFQTGRAEEEGHDDAIGGITKWIIVGDLAGRIEIRPRGPNTEMVDTWYANKTAT